MPSFEGTWHKPKTSIDHTIDSTMAQYMLELGSDKIHLNSLVGSKIKIDFKGQINCLHTGEKIKKTYGNGYSYKSFMSLARCDLCIVKPELCHFHKGTCREPKWGEKNCFIPHTIYLSFTSDLKVGITRSNNTISRWIDQGAFYALSLVQVKDRLTSGMIESELAKTYKDKTNFRKMLTAIKSKNSKVDSKQNLEEIKEQIFFEYGDLFDDSDANEVEEEVVEINYPILELPKKVKTLDLEKKPTFEGVLTGIKGTYLVFEDSVFNMRKYQGYYLYLDIS